HGQRQGRGGGLLFALLEEDEVRRRRERVEVPRREGRKLDLGRVELDRGLELLAHAAGDAPAGADEGGHALRSTHREVSAPQAEVEAEAGRTPLEFAAEHGDAPTAVDLEEGDLDAARLEGGAKTDAVVAETAHHLDHALLDLEGADGNDRVQPALPREIRVEPPLRGGDGGEERERSEGEAVGLEPRAQEAGAIELPRRSGGSSEGGDPRLEGAGSG